MANKQTPVQETAQALFCAMADYLGVAKVDAQFDTKAYPDYVAFKKKWDASNPSLTVSQVFKTRVDSPGVTLAQIEDLFQKDNDWYKSSVQIAKKLIHEIHTISKNFSKIQAPNWSQIFYARGDKAVTDGIGKLFKLANETQKKLNAAPGAKHRVVFTNMNKWNPADIYFSSEKAKREIADALRVHQNKSMTFSVLNGLTSSLIESGDLLPISLKEQPCEVTIKKVNFDRKTEAKEIEKYTYVGISRWMASTKERPVARHLNIGFDPKTPSSHITVRHDPSAHAFKAEVVHTVGSVSREGSASPYVMEYAIAIADGNATYSKKFITTFKKGSDEFTKQVNSKTMKDLKVKNRKKFDEEREWLSASLMTNAIFPDFMKWLSRDRNRSTRFVQLVYSYATARSEESGKFVIAK